ncbi:MAG TPA: hypothetical protein VFA97_13800 [Gaiellaceae bacterium]|nr:hypothetical protein [Gaiellaceae bacterium]
MFDRLKTGPAVTAAGALLLIAGGVIVVEHAQTVGTIVAALGALLVLRERIRSR